MLITCIFSGPKAHSINMRHTSSIEQLPQVVAFPVYDEPELIDYWQEKPPTELVNYNVVNWYLYKVYVQLDNYYAVYRPDTMTNEAFELYHFMR